MIFTIELCRMHKFHALKYVAAKDWEMMALYTVTNVYKNKNTYMYVCMRCVVPIFPFPGGGLYGSGMKKGNQKQ